MNSVNPRALSQAVTHQLMVEIQSGKFSQSSRLPAEDELAKEYGVSRSMMRECLTELERIGILSRRKGVGTLINRRIVNLPFRLDLITGLDSLLTKLGYITTSPYLEVSETSASEEVAKNLEINVGDPVFVVNRLLVTDNKPALFLTDFVSKSLLTEKAYTSENMIPSIFQFLRDEAGIETHVFLTEIRAVPLPEKVAQHLEMPTGAPILLLCETGFDNDNQPVLYSQEYLVDQVIPQMIVRSKI